MSKASDNGDDLRDNPNYKQILLDVERCGDTWLKTWITSKENFLLKFTEYDVTSLRKPSSSNSSDEISDNGEKEEEDSRTSGVSTDNQITNGDYCSGEESFLSDAIKHRVVKFIIHIIESEPDLHYYQGFHDVCLTFLAICNDEKKAKDKLLKLVPTHFKTFMQPTMKETQEYLDLIPVIIGLNDKEVEEFLYKSEVGTIFALSWMITWFSHVIPRYNDLKLLYEFFETSEPHVIIYFCSFVVLSVKNELMKLDCEMSTVHHFLCRAPKSEKLPINQLIKKTELAYLKWPPEIIMKERRVMQIKRRWKRFPTLGLLADSFSPFAIGKSNSLRAILVLGCAYLVSVGVKNLHINWMIDQA